MGQFSFSQRHIPTQKGFEPPPPDFAITTFKWLILFDIPVQWVHLSDFSFSIVAVLFCIMCIAQSMFSIFASPCVHRLSHELLVVCNHVNKTDRLLIWHVTTTPKISIAIMGLRSLGHVRRRATLGHHAKLFFYHENTGVAWQCGLSRNFTALRRECTVSVL